MKPNFCSFCGIQLPADEQEKTHPKCSACETTHWQNPRNVAVLLQPVKLTTSGLGLVVAARNIEPRRGGLALPAGFQEPNERLVETAAREFREESGVDDLVFSEDLLIVGERMTPAGHSLIFVQNTKTVRHEQVAELQDTSEAVQWQHIALDRRLPLCFPLHEEVAELWLRSHDAATWPSPMWRA